MFLFAKLGGVPLYSASPLIGQYLFCFWDVLFSIKKLQNYYFVEIFF